MRGPSPLFTSGELREMPLRHSQPDGPLRVLGAFHRPLGRYIDLRDSRVPKLQLDPRDVERDRMGAPRRTGDSTVDVVEHSLNFSKSLDPAPLHDSTRPATRRVSLVHRLRDR